MPDDTIMVGLTLLAVIPFVVWDTVSTLRAGFNTAFWELPLDEKMERIPDNADAWRRLLMVWLYINVLLAAGFTAFAFQLSGAGETIWAGLGLGAFLMGAMAFIANGLPGIMTVARGAEVMRDEDAVPPWVEPAWLSMWWMERTFVAAANVAYVSWGIGMIRSGFPAEWAGWVLVISGALIAAWVALRDDFFQHMVLIGPLATGVALLLA